MEIHERKVESKVKSVPIDFNEFQVSLNSWGHLTLRWFKTGDQNNDVVIILDATETNKVLSFLNRLQRTFQSDP